MHLSVKKVLEMYLRIKNFRENKFSNFRWISNFVEVCALKVGHTYPTIMKLDKVIPYQNKIQKVYKSRNTPLWSTDISIFSPDTNFCYIKKYRYRLHLNFFESLKVVLINAVAILMMFAKLSVLSLLKRKVFWNKGYEIIISVHDVTKKILSRH